MAAQSLYSSPGGSFWGQSFQAGDLQLLISGYFPGRWLRSFPQPLDSEGPVFYWGYMVLARSPLQWDHFKMILSRISPTHLYLPSVHIFSLQDWALAALYHLYPSRVYCPQLCKCRSGPLCPPNSRWHKSQSLSNSHETSFLTWANMKRKNPPNPP